MIAQNLPNNNQVRHDWGNFKGASIALAMAEIAQQHHGLTLIFTPHTLQAQRLEQEIAFFLPQDEVALLSFPDWEILPYDSFSPHQDIIAQRITALNQLGHCKKAILIVPISTALHRLAPPEFILGHSLNLKIGQKIQLDKLRRQLVETGYQCVNTVYEQGEFAIRGSIIDLFPMGSDHPYRIELFDDEIETLRLFEPESQRSLEKVDTIELLPAKEFPFTAEAILQFKNQFRDTFDVDYRRCPLYEDVKEGLFSAGIEYYLPLFFEQTCHLFAYLPKNTLIVQWGDPHPILTHFMTEVDRRYEDRRHDITRPILPPQKIFLETNEFFGLMKQFPRLRFHEDAVEITKPYHHNLNCLVPPQLAIEAKAQQPLHRLKNYLQQQNQQRILFCAESAGRRETLLEMLQRIDVQPKLFNDWQAFLADDARLGLTIGSLETGFALPAQGIHLITESQLFGQQVMQQRRRKKAAEDFSDTLVKNLTELQIGQPVVHIDHGVGRYQGLQCLVIDGQTLEFLCLEYAQQAKLYVPVSSLHLISRYSGGEEDHAPLHLLGTDQWQKARRKAAEKINDTAAELLNIYARRAAREGFCYELHPTDYELFCAGFPFEETPDQQTAIAAVLEDMKSPQPMDRLVCGDVGFGKTEVAMRATFIAIQNYKQVAILVPTTLLAQQHYESFKDRFADWPIQVEVLSRFRSAKEQQQVLDKLESGHVDLVIGTHKLLQASVKFKRLGLVIIDEEHRFGVKHKELLKALRVDVDMLTLTATPIPRTLNMAMAGMRDISIIATPPAKRLSIKTFVREYHSVVLKEAISRELLRGGQVYYLHNEVKTIEKTAQELTELVPEARVAIAHGQMHERELEQVMTDFYHKRHNLLVCTTIIETGIDVPTANTIIMDRADKLGLAQLHQLRGRVGRSHHQAYAYLLTPPPKTMTADAIKRLEAITQAEDLGAGFTLANHDLEIRGAGELLGDEQSGHVHAIGFSLYMEMLESAVQAIKEGKTPNLDQPFQQGPEINLKLPALIPEDYCGDVSLRLVLYKRIANASNESMLTDLQAEMIDRFGSLPEAVKHLFKITQLKLKATRLGIKKIEAGPKGGQVEFSAETQVHPLTLVKIIQSQPHIFRFNGADRLQFQMSLESIETRIQAISSLLEQLQTA